MTKESKPAAANTRPPRAKLNRKSAAIAGVILLAASLSAYSLWHNPKIRFANAEECGEHYIARAMFPDQARVAASACEAAFSPQDYEEPDIPVAACVLRHFDDIIDHAVGRRVVAECSRGSGSSLGRAYYARFEDPAAVEAREAAEEARQRASEAEGQQRMRLDRDDDEEVDRIGIPSGPVTVEVNGQTKICTRIGNTLDCD